MVNKNLFNEAGIKRAVPKTEHVNRAGGTAYKFEDKHALAQYCVTGTFSNIFYSTATEQLGEVQKLCDSVEPEFLAKLAVYAREVGKMKDTPAFLLAYLTAANRMDLVTPIFKRVLNNGKMLSNYVSIIRSGALGRRSLGTAPKAAIQDWLHSRYAKKLFITSIGVGDPSIADIIRLSHPCAKSDEEDAIFAYLLDNMDKYIKGTRQKKTNAEVFASLPEDIQIFEALKRGETNQIPDIPFRCLTNISLTKAQKTKIAMNAPWNTLRMNLNMFKRWGVLEDDAVVTALANKLSDPEEVKRNNAFPYQLLTTYQNVSDIPMKLKLALQDAMEHATENVAELRGETAVFVDTSASMTGSVTGTRQGQSSRTSCVDVAGLIASCVLRKNPDALIIAFDTRVQEMSLNPRDSVMTNAQHLARRGGGTDIGAPFRHVNKTGWKGDNIILVSDNESWASPYRFQYQSTTEAATEWAKFQRKNGGMNAKLVNIDLQAYGSTQVPDASKNVMNVGGWSDAMFKSVALFLNDEADKDFVATVEDYTNNFPRHWYGQ
jgi:60 kDa SS-A/Ro ribonucleoprotein